VRAANRLTNAIRFEAALSMSHHVESRATELDTPTVRFALNLSSAAIIAQKRAVVRRIAALLRQTSIVFGNVAELEALMAGLDDLYDAGPGRPAADDLYDADADADAAGGGHGSVAAGGGGGGGGGGGSEAAPPRGRRLRFTVERAVKRLLNLMGGKYDIISDHRSCTFLSSPCRHPHVVQCPVTLNVHCVLATRCCARFTSSGPRVGLSSPPAQIW